MIGKIFISQKIFTFFILLVSCILLSACQGGMQYRKLSKEDIKLKLIQLGYEEEYINKLSRWERVALLRYKSSEASKLVILNLILRVMRVI